MRLLTCDTNILIDLEEGRLLDAGPTLCVLSMCVYVCKVKYGESC